VTSTGQLGVLASSERYKTKVASMGGSSAKLKALRAVTYELKSAPTAGVQYGLIAESFGRHNHAVQQSTNRFEATRKLARA
jgi:Chaperone of endosialidase